MPTYWPSATGLTTYVWFPKQKPHLLGQPFKFLNPPKRFWTNNHFDDKGPKGGSPSALPMACLGSTCHKHSWLYWELSSFFPSAFYILLTTLEIEGCTKVSQWQPGLSFVDPMGQLKHFQGKVVSLWLGNFNWHTPVWNQLSNPSETAS